MDAFMNGDVEWYREHLAEAFVIIDRILRMGTSRTL